MEATTEIDSAFKAVEFQFIKRFGKRPTLEAILMMIGFQECPVSSQKRDKEEKVDLINLGVLVVMEKLGFFKRIKSEAAWPEFEPTEKQATEDKEFLIKRGIVQYFKDNQVLP